MTMTCDQFREGHPSKDEAARAHQAQCGPCATFARAWELLGEYPPIEPSAGYFRAVRRKLAPAILRFAAPVAAAAAALLVALFLGHAPSVKPVPSGPTVTDEERELVENLDLIQNYQLLRTFELMTENGSPLVEEKK
jgi:hypothetical protein